MAISITALQNEPNLRVFRRCEVKRRVSGGSYESNWFDVSSLVTSWPVISWATDRIEPFKYRRGNAQIAFRNEEKQFSSEIFAASIFGRYATRYKTLCRISTGLEDEDGVEYPTSTQVFLGLFSDDISDTDVETYVNVNDISQALLEFPSANIAPSVTGQALTSEQIIGTIRDYQDSGGNVVLDPYISSGAWILSSTGRTYNIATSTDLQGLSALDLIEKLAQAENSVFYIDGAGNARFNARTFSATSDYTFNGPGEDNVNIITLNSYNEAINRIYTKVTCFISDSAYFVTTQQAFTLGDGSSSDLYGVKEISFNNNFIDSSTAGSICSDLLSEFQNKKRELVLTTKYITQLGLNNRVTVNYKGEGNGDGSLWGSFIWGINLWSGYRGGIKIDGEDFGITQIDIDMDQFKSTFYMREV